MSRHRYRAFELVIGSAQPIASLAGAEIERAGLADVVITERPLAMPAAAVDYDGVMVAVEDNALFLGVDEIGTFRVADGRTIEIARADGATEDHVNLYLLGSVIGVILYQRGLLPIHSNAVVVGGKAFLFCGDSGAGKSTLAAWFQREGLPLLTDDVSAVRFGALAPEVLPGIPRLKLWRNSLDLFAIATDGLRQLPWGIDKFEMAVATDAAAVAAPVGAIYHLRVAGDARPPGIHRLAGLDAANTVTANIYRRRFGDLMGIAPQYLPRAIGLALQTPIFAVYRNWGLDHFEAEALAIREHMQTIAEQQD